MVVIEECPSLAWISLGCAPCSISREAQVWRRSVEPQGSEPRLLYGRKPYLGAERPPVQRAAPLGGEHELADGS